MATYSTPLEALKACLEIWKELARIGSEYKSDAYANLGINIGRDLFECPACEYTRESEGGYCKCEACPAWEFQGTDYMCEAEGSPYRNWLRCITAEQRKSAARGMVKFIRLRVEYLEK